MQELFTLEQVLATPSNEIFCTDLDSISTFGLRPIPIEMLTSAGTSSQGWFFYGSYHKCFRIQVVQPANEPKEPMIVHDGNLASTSKIPSEEHGGGWRGQIGEQLANRPIQNTFVSTANRNRSGQFQTCAPHQRYTYPNLRG